MGTLQDDIVLSGDKKGQVAIWNFEKVRLQGCCGMYETFRMLQPLLQP